MDADQFLSGNPVMFEDEGMPFLICARVYCQTPLIDVQRGATTSPKC